MMPETVRCAKVISVGLLVGSVTAGIGTLLLASTAFGAAGGGDGGAPPVCCPTGLHRL
ncbi:MAG: hypothetical protein HYW10_00475 [Candidatus Omnitrophica bacterium]|nr:hypothetical protein [Candidatus Omnitrophota bacterium]